MSFSKWSEKRLKLASCGHELTHEVSKQLFAKFYLQDGLLGVLYRRVCHMGGHQLFTNPLISRLSWFFQ